MGLIDPVGFFAPAAGLASPPVHRAAYSDRMAWLMASMALLAYERFEDGGASLEELRLGLKDGGFALKATFSDPGTDTQAFLATGPRFAVLAFRGTEPTRSRDVETDLASWKVSTLAGRVHAGFATAYAAVEPAVLAALDGLGDAPLYVTGHSLGAALATVCTQRLEHHEVHRERLAACYTFGSPRVGDEHYDLEFKAPIYRVVNRADVVPLVPLASMGYRHVGDVRYLGPTGVLWRVIPHWRRAFAVLGKLGDLLGDHAIGEYRRKLEALARARNPRG